ncbi:MAG: transposase [Cenarchaeum sp. SB0665_bin_23]|nr:transposase [Cenarchaeum sp. SB0667_bin_13]MXY60777.1 transposase [Cenarchaeum sp. SB0665_bin_23]MYB46310.1 transposase [Cenarchaeum sp. SB0662_bin_33]MYC79395.1 transposase [Cenarchaeum sp. SB0661_bin_35]MYG32982.1 transposase [Cenarchaeum sp. SB0677_bin_16]
MSHQQHLTAHEFRNNPKIRAQIIEHLETLISPLVNVSTGHNAFYNVGYFNRGIIRTVCADASVGGCASGVSAGSDAIVPPSDEWFRVRLATMKTDEVQNMFKESVMECLLNLKQLYKLPKDGIVVAIDMHLIPRYDRIRGEELARSKYKNGTKYFERYVTLQCVNDDIRLNLVCLQVPALESVPNTVRTIIQECLSYGITIKLCLLDREFFSAETILNLNKLNIPYLMPCRNTQGVVEKQRLFVAVLIKDTIHDHTITGRTATATYNMIITERKNLDPKKDAELPEEKYIGIATNLNWIDPTVYSVRWGIESGYAMLESMRAKTRSRKVGARLFCFLYSLMMFNNWMMIKILMLSMTKYISRHKSTITQLAFKQMLRSITDDAGPGPPI